MGIQVTGLTQGKQPWEKEFIDFQFDGKYVSEFGMVVVNDGDRHSFDTSPTFENETSSVNGLDGQYYWGTNFSSLKRTFMLATDGMTEAQVNAFKLHFRPGKYGKFIEDKLAHRYGYCRVSEITTFNVVPFRIEKRIKGKAIKINEYKGDCRITFEWDVPYFYSTESYLTLTDDNYDSVLRAIYANGTPLNDSWENRNGICYIGDPEEALKGGITVTAIPHTGGNPLIFYNPSTGPTSSIITLTYTPKFTKCTASSKWTPVYVDNIADEINYKYTDNFSVPYNTVETTKSLAVINQNIPTAANEDYVYQLKYSSPNFIYSINKTIQIAYNYYQSSKTGPLIDLEEKLRLEIINDKVISWAMSVLRIIKTKSTLYNSSTGNFQDGVVTIYLKPPIYTIDDYAYNADWFAYFNVFMLEIMGTCSDTSNFHLENQYAWSTSFPPFSITFNGEENYSRLSYNYNQIISTVENIHVSEETCGDVIHSAYLQLDGGDTLDDNGKVASCHLMRFLEGGSTQNISEASLQYKYTYL